MDFREGTFFVAAIRFYDSAYLSPFSLSLFRRPHLPICRGMSILRRANLAFPPLVVFFSRERLVPITRFRQMDVFFPSQVSTLKNIQQLSVSPGGTETS